MDNDQYIPGVDDSMEDIDPDEWGQSEFGLMDEDGAIYERDDASP